MSKFVSPRQPERDETVAALEAVREKTNQELDRREHLIEETTDRALEDAQKRSDEVLSDTRRREDEKQLVEGEKAAVSRRETRAKEDTSIAHERVKADARRLEEREEHRQILRELLRAEREATDLCLQTERIRLDKALLARDDFLKMTGYDFRTLVHAIALQVAFLRRRIAGKAQDEVAQQSADRIQRLLARMNRLLSDFFDVASIEAGQFAVRLEASDVLSLLRDTMEVFQPAAQDLGAVLTYEISSHALTALLDYDRILQVLSSLIGNALSVTPEGGKIVLRAAPDGEMVRFVVTDTGAGVPAGQEQAIFERFVQAGSSSPKGLGLGLFIARCIVEAHGGRLWLEKTSAEGSTFCFTLPRASPASL